jgi:RNA polymerase sigma-70 factor (ECF subfamily)
VTLSARSSSAAPLAREEVPQSQRFAALHRRNCDGIWRYLRRLGLTSVEADDATQQVFLVVARKLEAVKPGAERSFAYEVASRVASEVRRSAARRCEVALPAELRALDVPDGLLEERQRLALLDSILAAMPEDLRQVFALYEIEELSLKEIAMVLKMPQGTVASRLRRAREQFAARAARCRQGELP